MPDLPIGWKRFQEIFVGVEERRRILLPTVPNEGRPSTGFKDAQAFCAGAGAVEPVEGLTGRVQIDARLWQWHALGRRVDTREPFDAAKGCFCRRSHGLVRLDRPYLGTSVEQQLGQDPRAAPHIGNPSLRSQPASLGKEIEYRWWVAGPVGHIFRDSVGKSLRRVHEETIPRGILGSHEASRPSARRYDQPRLSCVSDGARENWGGDPGA